MKPFPFTDEEIAKMNDLKQAGDIVAAFEPLILSSIKKYYSIGDYEELIQEGRLEILEAVLDYDGRIHFPGYLKTRLKYFYLNKNNRRREIAVDPAETLENILVADDDPEEETAVKEDILKLRKAMKRLSKRQREVIGLSFLKGLKQKEIAEILGITEGSVGTHKRRGLKRLRELMEE